MWEVLSGKKIVLTLCLNLPMGHLKKVYIMKITCIQDKPLFLYSPV